MGVVVEELELWPPSRLSGVTGLLPRGGGNMSAVLTTSMLTVFRLICLTVAFAVGSARVTGLGSSGLAGVEHGNTLICRIFVLLFQMYRVIIHHPRTPYCMFTVMWNKSQASDEGRRQTSRVRQSY